MSPKVLFILKKRESVWDIQNNYSTDLSSGLLNSASFVNNMLSSNGIVTKLVTVADNNSIDYEVTNFSPNIVIIEALWVVPDKFDTLLKLHPRVLWIIRNHSEIPFLSTEGIAMEWMLKYLSYQNVLVSSNSDRATSSIRDLIRSKFPGMSEKQISAKTPYLPNYYPVDTSVKQPDIFDPKKEYIDVGCFGAIRPLKNHLIQALAAIKFAKGLGKKLRFHINGGRLEGKGEPILKNIQSLFENDSNNELVQYSWLSHPDFINVVRQMDIGLQVSFSETFNIVTADFVTNNIPVVVSKEISWMWQTYKADPTDIDDIVSRMTIAKDASKHYLTKMFNIHGLNEYNEKSKHHWFNFLRSLKF